jgi:hypothetical protein
MFKKTSAMFIAALLILTNLTTIVAQQSDAVALDRRVKAQVNDLGAGAKVTVFLKDGTKVRGSISQILDDSFDVTINKETQSSIISYRDVEKVKRRGWTTGAKVGIGVAVGAGVIVTMLAVLLSSSDGF